MHRRAAIDPVQKAAWDAAGRDANEAAEQWAEADLKGDAEAAQVARMRWKDAMTRLTTIGPPTHGKVLPWPR